MRTFKDKAEQGVADFLNKKLEVKAVDWGFLQPARVSLGSATQRRSMITKQLFIVDGGGRNLGVKAQTWKSIRARHVPCELTQVFDIIQGAHGGEFQKTSLLLGLFCHSSYFSFHRACKCSALTTSQP